MDCPPNTLCAKCFKVLKSNYISCHICRAKIHLICANIDEKQCNLFKENKNIVFNCNDCLKASSEMISLISSISSELRELKNPIVSTMREDVKEIKLRFDELTKNLEQSYKQKKQFSKFVVDNSKTQHSAANQRSNNDSVLVHGSSEVDKQYVDDACSSLMSAPTAVSQVRSNMYETDDQENNWTKVRRRRRRNRVIVVGDKDTDDLDVVARKKYLHLSSFKPTVTADKIIEYIEKNSEIGKQHLECTRLVKKDVDESSLKFVNFKLGVSSCFYDDIIKSNFWPVDIKLRPFVFYPRKPVELPDLQ